VMIAASSASSAADCAIAVWGKAKQLIAALASKVDLHDCCRFFNFIFSSSPSNFLCQFVELRFSQSLWHYVTG
jgi:hypothetical protein